MLYLCLVLRAEDTILNISWINIKQASLDIDPTDLNY